MDTPASQSRRPIATRSQPWARALARFISSCGISANQVSIFGIFISLIGGGFLLTTPHVEGVIRAVCFAGAAVCIQLRLLCNMIDGLVAVENQRGSKNGILYNEVPDRLEDAVLLVCAGYSVAIAAWAVPVAWLCSLLAIATAYLRAFGASLGQPQDFSGPMAKPQRMFFLTIGCLCATIATLAGFSRTGLDWFLLLIAVGTALTCFRRISHISNRLNCS